MTFSFDWRSLEEHLFEQSKEVIFQFAGEHPHITCSFFAYGVEPEYGYFQLNFDTDENSIHVAKQREQQAIQHRNLILSQEWSWRNAKFLTTFPRVMDYSPEVGDFAYPMYAEITFQKLRTLRESERYPQKNNPVEDDYLEGNVRVLLWKVIERLITNGVFQCLHMASPFRIGFEFHDEELVVFRILNWPSLDEASIPLSSRFSQ